MEELQLDRSYALLTFVAKQRSRDLCGSNGLPLTPSSINILGRAQLLRSLHHPNLLAYLHFHRGKHGRTVIVSEQYGTPLHKFIINNTLEILNLSRDVLRALAYLHRNGIVHNALSMKNIFNSNNTWKLFNYGMYYMTGNGLDVLFPIGDPLYKAPEVILLGPNKITSGKSDIWSLGLIILQLLFNFRLSDGEHLNSNIKQCLSFIQTGDVIEFFADKFNKHHILEKLPMAIVKLVKSMLAVDPTNRPTARELLESEIFMVIDYEKKNICRSDGGLFTLDRPSTLELYNYWQLAGGDVYAELKREGLIRSNPPILTIPNLLLLEGVCYGQKNCEADSYEEQLVFLSMHHIIERFNNSKVHDLRDYNYFALRGRDFFEAAHLPVAIKERDTDYQFKRIQIFKKIFKLLPKRHDLLLREARLDIPPFLRSRIWAFILKIDQDYSSIYRSIDKETPLQTDRQIEVDIPRCHQYNELLSSSTGHAKFKRILKAWVKSHPEYVYWQGLDSLCAPFLFLNFTDEAKAYTCLSKFINKYLHNFFLRDNSVVIKEYLAKFKHLIAFLDPELANHLHKIGFSPELFAIPWFLTMFSHVFPIQKILDLWDALLLGNASFPLYIGFSILQQLRSVLLESGFNECILLFSDLPEIDIEKCVKDSHAYSKNTPRSITYRKNEILSYKDSLLVMGMTCPDYSLDIMMNEYCPRICADEVNKMIRIAGIRQNLLLIDIRHPALFADDNLPGSSNLYYGPDMKPENIFGPKMETNAIFNVKGRVVVVYGNSDKECAEFCKLLSTHGVPRVCSVHGGLRALINLNSKQGL